MRSNKTIRLVGVDLDGTLLNDDKQLCNGALDTIKKAAAAGIRIVPITGRPLKGIPECIRAVKEFEFYICSNGAQIIDAKTDIALYSFSINNEKSCKIIELLRGFECSFEPFADGVGYSEPEVFEYYKNTFSNTPLADYVFSSRVVTNSIEALYINTQREADEFFISCKSEGVRSAVLKALNTVGGLQYCLLGDRFLEVTRLGTDKGAALEALCGHLDIPVSETMAFGDGENDLLFLERAGIAVAMENAHPAVKERADIIADTNNNNGVCKVIEEYI